VRDETKRLLALIVEKADKLRRFDLEDHVREVGLGFSAQRQEDGSWLLELGLPDEEKRDAFLLTFRFFNQKNERTSFYRVVDLADDPGISDEWRNEVSRLQRAYCDYLDGHSEYTVNLFDGQPTRGEMLDIGLYGGLVHANRPSKVQRYRLWTRDEVRAGLFHQELTRILVRVLQLIYQLAQACRKELQAVNPPKDIGNRIV
jgi:hypothetical protein